MRDTSKYCHEGVRFPSVTEVLKLVHYTTYEYIRGVDMEYYADRGGEVHQWTELLDHGIKWEPIGDSEIDNRLAAYQKFLAEHTPTYLEIEAVALDRRYGFAGTYDRSGWFGEGHDMRSFVLDIKCSTTPHWSTGLQLAAYKAGIWGAGGADNVQRYGLSLRGDGTYLLHEYPFMEERADLDDFLSALRVVWRRIRQGDLSIDDLNNVWASNGR